MIDSLFAAGIGRRLHTERFGAAGRESAPDDTTFTVRLARTGVSVTVAAEQTLLEAISELPSDYSEGYCGLQNTRPRG
ncbi:hypothetical protein [Rhodococcus erythropolis]|uniref:hypothetical protein n=1 Tax=Rhodococcus erythropolis TaxID=1833 RepID=UPI000878BB05|nr:hypothetical protein [Rhodococcus erythropolis]OFV73846.1 hypothetical protein RERY_55490 [Rhodococcus erythropolis]